MDVLPSQKYHACAKAALVAARYMSSCAQTNPMEQRHFAKFADKHSKSQKELNNSSPMPRRRRPKADFKKAVAKALAKEKEKAKRRNKEMLTQHLPNKPRHQRQLTKRFRTSCESSKNPLKGKMRKRVMCHRKKSRRSTPRFARWKKHSCYGSNSRCPASSNLSRRRRI